MICDFCRHEVVIPESRELLIRAWCPNCGAFSDGKERMRLPASRLDHVPQTHAPTEQSEVPPLDKKKLSELRARVHLTANPELMAALIDMAELAYADITFADGSSRTWKSLSEEASEIAVAHADHSAKLFDEIKQLKTYRDTLKTAQENGTNLWNKVVRVKNLLRVAQPYLEEDNARNPDELELAALCNEIEKEIGSLEDNITADDGKLVAERLGIDMEKWAKEIEAKIDAAAAKEKEER